jgi:hypothetical protein
MTGVKKSKKQNGSQEGRRKTLWMKNIKERLCLVIIIFIIYCKIPLIQSRLQVSALIGAMCPGIQAQWRSPILRFL